jgi:hypothetical protein
MCKSLAELFRGRKDQLEKSVNARQILLFSQKTFGDIIIDAMAADI